MSPFVRRASIRHADRVLARSVFLLLMAVFVASMPGRLVGERGREQYEAARELVFDLRLVPNPERGTISLEALPGPGAAIVGAPFVLIGYGLTALAPEVEARQEVGWEAPILAQTSFGLAGGVLMALCGWLIVLAARRVGAKRPAAFLAALGFGLASHAWAGGQDGIDAALVTFGLLAAFHILLRVREELDRLRVPRGREFVAAGLAVGLACASDPTLAPAALFVAVVFQLTIRAAWKRLDASRWNPKTDRTWTLRRASLAFWAPVVATLVLVGYVHRARHGCPLEGELPWGLRPLADWPGTFLGLLLSPGEGLVWFAPWILITPWAKPALRGRQDPLGPWMTAAVAGWCLLRAVVLAKPLEIPTFGPRELLPGLAFFALGLALALRGAGPGWRRTVAGGLLVLGVLVQVPGALVSAELQHELAARAYLESTGSTADAPDRSSRGAAIELPLERGGEGASEADRTSGAPPAAELDGQRAGATEATGSAPASEVSPVHAARSVARLAPDLARRDPAFRRLLRWDWRFSPPWAHWRILRDRAAVGGESVSAAELYWLDSDVRIRPQGRGDWGFSDLAWVHLERHYGISAWWIGILVGAFAIVGSIFALLGLDTSAA